ncbi:DUF1801 domain-containing protein [Mucilaginibacter rigui]|uniref:DUF1801 domain-containing protein n=1 Tax=Mucilaginibacter rigui TaxID=534635 RepID=A0ABR7X006_9SPHI|nr:DUF1801 domain-containing protein [Mucilaginibacter rigui]MBD1383922.1 DUF1801 domain-containing protein [Mucilaginibacter rigui]
MPKAMLTPQQQVTEHIQNLDPAIRDVIEMLRQIILDTHSEIAEQIKWNNPSFYYTGELAPFDPKEYKRDIIVMNLHKKRIMLVLPSGAKINDTSGLLEGDYKDGRRLAIFKDMADVKAKADALQGIIKQWISLIDK